MVQIQSYSAVRWKSRERGKREGEREKGGAALLLLIVNSRGGGEGKLSFVEGGDRPGRGTGEQQGKGEGSSGNWADGLPPPLPLPRGVVRC